MGRVWGRRCCGFGDVRIAFKLFRRVFVRSSRRPRERKATEIGVGLHFFLFRGSYRHSISNTNGSYASLSRFIPNPSLDSFPAAALSTKDTALSDAQRRTSVLEKEVSKLREDVVKWRSDAAASQLALSQHAAAAPAQTRMQQQQSYVAPAQSDSEMQQQLSKVSLPSTRNPKPETRNPKPETLEYMVDAAKALKGVFTLNPRTWRR